MVYGATMRIYVIVFESAKFKSVTGALEIARPTYKAIVKLEISCYSVAILAQKATILFSLKTAFHLFSTLFRLSYEDVGRNSMMCSFITNLGFFLAHSLVRYNENA